MHFWSCVVALVAASPLVAQAPTAAAATAVAVASGTGLDRVDGRLVGVGPHYKAGFDRDGIEFVPAFGMAAPRNLPLCWHPEAAHRGDAPVRLRQVEPVARDQAVEYARGTIIERYALRADGLEQSFVFQALPPGNGDLVVRGRLDTELTIAAVGDGLRLRAPGIGSFGIGEVTGVDANGARCRGALRLDGNALELRLPSAFVADAALPLVLDPVIGTGFALESLLPDDRYPDIAYDLGTTTYLVVWTHTFSSVDRDIYAQRVTSGNHALVGGVILVDATSLNTELPAVADLRATQSFVAVFQRSGSVLARAIDAATGALGTAVTVAAGQRPDVGGLQSGMDARFACVWHDTATGSVRSAVYTLANLVPTLASGPNVLFAGSVSAPFTWPRLSKTGGVGCVGNCTPATLLQHHRWAVVAQRDWSTDSDLRLGVIDWNGALVASQVLDSSTEDHELGDVDGDGHTWIVAWHKRVSATDYDVLAMSVSYPGSGSALVLNTPTPMPIGAMPNVWERRATVCWIGESCLIGFVRETAPGMFAPIVATRSLIGCDWCGADVGFGYGSPLGAENWGAFASLRSGGLTESSSALGVHTWIDPGNGNNGQLFGFPIEVPDGHRALVGAGCGPYGGQGTSTCAILGNANFRFVLRDARPNSTAWLVLSTSRTWLQCGSCRLVADPFSGITLSVSLDSNGNGWSGLSIPGAPQYLGMELVTQWLVPNGSAAACPLFGLDMSEAVRVFLQ